MGNDSKKSNNFEETLESALNDFREGLIEEKELFLHEVIERYGPTKGSQLLGRFLSQFKSKFGLTSGRSPINFFSVKGNELHCFSIQENILDESIVGLSVVPDVNFDLKRKYKILSKKTSKLHYYPLNVTVPFREDLVLKVPIFFTSYDVSEEPNDFNEIGDIVLANRIGINEPIILSHYCLESLAKKLGKEYKITGENIFGDKETAEIVFGLLKENSFP